MSSETRAQIEQSLLAYGGWVASQDICSRFGLNDDRPLRQVAGVPGLCTGFAISGNKGFKHVTFATTTEWLRFKHRLRRHGISELVRVRNLDKRRSNVLRVTKKRSYEKDTGQVLMGL